MGVMLTLNVVFMTDFPTKEIKCKLNVVSNSSYDISGENFVEHFFGTCKAYKNLKQNKINSTSFQDLILCQN